MAENLRNLRRGLLNIYQNLDKVTLEVRSSNSTAQKFYQESGFKRIAVRPQYYIDTNEDAIVYWKILHPPFHYKPA